MRTSPSGRAFGRLLLPVRGVGSSSPRSRPRRPRKRVRAGTVSGIDDIEVIPYASRYRRSFESLNSVWIDKHFWMEDLDLRVLRDPEGEIIAEGGMVFFARAGDSIVGTGAVINHGNGLYEISKMAVDEDFQRKGIGRRIITRAIDWVRERSGRKIFIETNTVLERAVTLYRQSGFVSVEDTSGESHYERTNLHLELEL